jgi:hypothetical protein
MEALILSLSGLLLQPASGGRGAEEPAVITSRRAQGDFVLTADPDAPAWAGIAGVLAERDRHGKAVPGHRTEIRSRWTPRNLYLLFVCPYEELFLKPDPSASAETPRLWEWDVAEVVGTDFQHRALQGIGVSPQASGSAAIDRGVQPPTTTRRGAPATR